MKKATEGIIFLFLAITSIQLHGQASPYSQNHIIISFKADVSELAIDALQSAYTANEVARFPNTDIRVWEITNFPVNFVHQGNSNTLININNVNQSAMQQAEVEGVDFNYLMEYYENRGESGSSDPGASFDCGGTYEIKNYAGNFRSSLSILDTGFSPNDSHDGTDLYLDIDLFDGYNYIDNTTNVDDGNGHGTHVASVINHVSHSASAIDPADTYTDYFIQKSFDQEGIGYLSDIIEAIDHSISLGINILNFSFGYKARKPNLNVKTPMQKALAAAEAANILIVASAGNDFGLDNDLSPIKNYPASFEYPNILSVASVNCSQNLSVFSNYGKHSIDVAAPGEFIEGATPGGEIELMSGTSQATAIVSGIANSLASHLAHFDYEKVKCAILASVDFSPELSGKILTSGIVNAKNALSILNNCNYVVLPLAGGIPGARSSNANPVDEKIKVYPNPVTDHLSIDFDLIEAQALNYFITDLSGKVVKSGLFIGHQGENRFRIPINNQLQNGMYLMNINSDKIAFGTKFTILR